MHEIMLCREIETEQRIEGFRRKLEEKQVEIGKLAQTVTDLRRDVKELQKMHGKSMHLGQKGVFAYDILVAEVNRKRNEPDGAKRYRSQAGRHFGVEPSKRMRAAFARDFPTCRGIMRSPSRSRSPSPRQDEQHF